MNADHPHGMRGPVESDGSFVLNRLPAEGTVSVYIYGRRDDRYALARNVATTGKALDLTGFTGVSDLVADSAEQRDQFLFASGVERPTDLKIGPDGHLYIVALADGAIYRVIGPGRKTVPVTPLMGRVVLWLALAVSGPRAPPTSPVV